MIMMNNRMEDYPDETIKKTGEKYFNDKAFNEL